MKQEAPSSVRWSSSLSQNFITNAQERTVERRLRTLIKHSKELKFLVGFFYFSGVQALSETLRELEKEGKLK